MNIRPKNILLIDGNKRERLAIVLMLTRFGHKVKLVTHGKEACHRIESEEFDLLIVNDRLADMSGLDFLSRIKKEKSIKAIYLSSKGSVEEFVQVVKLGVFEYVRKPVSPVQFAVIICDFFIQNRKEHQFQA